MVNAKKEKYKFKKSPVSIKLHRKARSHEKRNDQKREILKAKELIITPSGDKVIDFGQNLVGWVQFKSDLPRGSKVTLYHSEVLDKAGEFYTTNLRAAKQKNTFILNGKKINFITPPLHFRDLDI